MSELNERLGFSPDERVVIINCDDFGLTHSVNQAVVHSMTEGIATSATMMVPCPWAREAAEMAQGLDVGVHLTLNSENAKYRWGPITYAPSLLDGDGGFPRTIVDVWEHADMSEVSRECRAQVERAKLWGVDVTHLDSHMGTLQLRPEFFDVYLDLAIEFQLPLRMAGAAVEDYVGFPFRQLAAEQGVVFPDAFVYVGGVGSRATVEQMCAQLRPGVTEVYVHPSVDSDEIRAATPTADARIDDLDLVSRNGSLAGLLDQHGVRRISFRPLRDLMQTTRR